MDETELQDSVRINTNDIDNEIGTQTLDNWYVVLDCFNDRYMSYLCHPQELLTYKHYLQNAVSILTFNDYSEAYNYHQQVISIINKYTRYFIDLNNQIKQLEKEFQHQIQQIKGH